MQRLGALVERLLGRQLPGFHRLPALVVHVGDHRLHDQDGQKQRQAHQHLIGRRGLRAQRLPQEVQHHRDAQKRRDRHHHRRQQRQQRQQDDDLHRHAERGAVLSGRYAEKGEGFGRRRHGRKRRGQTAPGCAAVSLAGLRCRGRGKLSTSEQPEGEDATSSSVSPTRTRCRVCCGPSGSRSRHSSRRPADFLRSATPANPRRRSHHNVAPSSSSTTATAAICSITSIPSFRPTESLAVRSRRGSR